MSEKVIAMIPARMGSQRLKRKNLRTINGMTLIEWAIVRCKRANVFDEIFINSEATEFQEYAKKHGISFYHRPSALGNNTATSEDFVKDFLTTVDCKSLVQVHSITPLLTATEIQAFVKYCNTRPEVDTVLSCIEDQIEVAYLGEPINFNTTEKTNSQNLTPVQRLTWAISKWDTTTFLSAVEAGQTGTYSGSIGYFPCSAMSGFPIKTRSDLEICKALFELSANHET